MFGSCPCFCLKVILFVRRVSWRRISGMRRSQPKRSHRRSTTSGRSWSWEKHQTSLGEAFAPEAFARNGTGRITNILTNMTNIHGGVTLPVPWHDWETLAFSLLLRPACRTRRTPKPKHDHMMPTGLDFWCQRVDLPRSGLHALRPPEPLCGSAIGGA